MQAPPLFPSATRRWRSPRRAVYGVRGWTRTQADDSLPSFDITGQVALVTGASSGIGEHFAEVLAAAGAKVAAAARRADRLAELARAHRGGGGACLPVACDVTDRTASSPRSPPPRPARAAVDPRQQRRRRRLEAVVRAHRGRLGLRRRHQSEGRLAGGARIRPPSGRERSGRGGSSTSPRSWLPARSAGCRPIAPPKPGSHT